MYITAPAATCASLCPLAHRGARGFSGAGGGIASARLHAGTARQEAFTPSRASHSAGPAVTAEALAAMESANDDFARALADGDVELALRSDDAFHAVLTGLSGNGMIEDVLEQATPLIRRAERQRFASLAARGSVEQHRAIVASLRAGDTDGAARLSRENWMTLDRHLHEA
ncbi:MULTISPECIES: FCD domain-containing protein [unclassified Rathayibacter]|uniref:FCD domain-containing protein n=1 Tax=unclassified Rathayibacter TaxID=2609250 RepID=UPI0021579C73|nr:MULTISPECIES: FCD domain-containing protein [unclassified Rathayibacter]